MADEMERPSFAEVDAARKVMEADYKARYMGGGTGWREHWAYDLARAERRATMESVMDSLTDAVDSGEVVTVDALGERLDETVDGYMIYNLSAGVYMLATDNGDAWRELGMDAPDSESVAATLALRADVEESREYAALRDRVEAIENGEDDAEEEEGQDRESYSDDQDRDGYTTTDTAPQGA